MKGTSLRSSSDVMTLPALFQMCSKKAEIVHHFAENLAQTLGVFHGVNETGQKLAVEGEIAMALNTILFDQLQVMVIRLCALCGNGSRRDDASIGELVEALSGKDFQIFLVEREEEWVKAVGHRGGSVGEVRKFIRIMKARYVALEAETEGLDRIRHYRNKVLAHATTGLDPERKALVGDIWRLSRLVLSVAKYIRLVLERKEWNYLDHSADGRARGKALVLALHHRHK